MESDSVSMSVRNIFKTHRRGFNFGINKTFNMRDKSDSQVNGSYLKQFGVKKWEQFQSYSVFIGFMLYNL